MNSKLFEKNTIGSLQLKNRVIRSAAGSGIASKEGYVTQHVKDWYSRVSSGGASLLISEMMTVWDDGNFPEGYLRIDNDKYIEGLKEISDIVHKNNSKIIAQIGNYGSLLHWEPLKTPVGPSKVNDSVSGITPKELSTDEVKKLIDHFVSTAKRAKEASFDGVQIHAAHGFLLNKFLNPYYNKRRDQYGGSTENRARILSDIAKAIKEECGKDFIVLLKINTSDFTHEDHGFTFDESLRVCKTLSKDNYDAIELTSGVAGARVSPARSKNEIAYNKPYGRIIADEIEIPIILVGGIRSFDIAEEILQNTQIQYIGMTRALTKNPDLIKQWEQENYTPSDCTSCNLCFTSPGQMCVLA
jgi:2,4-dienoyl-CoA reductase-like NADH-dependent reductase (Old Yellow Enzyme family)